MAEKSCYFMTTKAEKMWPFDQYYLGQRDNDDVKEGKGEYHWTGAKSMEWYTGEFLRNTMHGLGEYRWRYHDIEGTFSTYEGHFYSNNMHGYGTMSYPNGKVFTGIYNNNMRWGPGVETYADGHEDVGLWRGTQLIRLAWRPTAVSIVPDLNKGSIGRNAIEPHRIILTSTRKAIKVANSALDLLKQNGCDSRLALERWMKLYPKNCTDQASQLCQVDIFDREYYKEIVNALEVTDVLPENEKNTNKENSNSDADTGLYFAWNNHWMIVDMMKHCFKHEWQRQMSDMSRYEISSIVAGPRSQFKSAGLHEIECRTLLMASYLGRVANVVQLVNESGVYPDIADNKGNTAIMYATCGNHSDVIHFLVEAGADVNNCNDSCCTPLGIALMSVVCTQRNINPSGIIEALLPALDMPHPPVPEQKVFEWNIIREDVIPAPGALTRASSKMKTGISKKNKSSQSLKDLSDINTRKKTDIIQSIATGIPGLLAASVSEEEKVYNEINLVYINKLNDLFSLLTTLKSLVYVFEVNDLIKEIGMPEPDKMVAEKASKRENTKDLKEVTKTSKDMTWKTSDKDSLSVGSVERHKKDALTQIMTTVLQLLADGANPSLVTCPQPGLFMAIIAGCPDLVRHLASHGADVNEIYPNLLGYTPLDIAVSLPFSDNSLELIRTLFECGSKTSYRLSYSEHGEVIPGPTLLHAVLAKKAESEMEEEIRRQILELLLKYKCNPLIQFKGHSAVDVALTKNIDMIDVFINSPITNLNACINDTNQTILVKMFSLPYFKTVTQADRLEILTNLLLYGADPLIECQNGEDIYENIFSFAKRTLADLASSQVKINPTGSSVKSDPKKQAEKLKKEEKITNKPLAQVDDVAEFKQAQELLTECARLLYIRWLQAKLVKDLISIINRFRHRHWNMILNEHKKKKCSGLWLTVERCLEIWDILKATKKKVYTDQRVLRHLLSIVLYYWKKYKIRSICSKSPRAQEKNMIDSDVSRILREYKVTTSSTTEFMSLKRAYVKPELDVKTDSKFNVCFECILPLKNQNIECECCHLVSFCTFECMRLNIYRSNCHPCSEYLKNKYFPSPIGSVGI